MPATTTTRLKRPVIKETQEVFLCSDFRKSTQKRRLKSFNSNGTIYVDKFIRELFKGCYFSIEVSEGKIVLDPVKIEEFEEADGG